MAWYNPTEWSIFNKDSPAEKAAKAEASKEVAADRLRLNEQVALMMNLDNLLNNIPNGDNIKRTEKIYNNFATFRGPAGGHISLTNKIYRNESIQYLFSHIDSSVLSSLVPTIEIYKVFFPKKENNAKGYSWRVPFDDVSAKYEGQTSPYVEKSIDELLAGDGRMHGVGIRSFRYKFVGTNPAEVNSNIEAEIELFFQDVRDLVKRIYFNKDDVNFINNPAIDPFYDVNAGEQASYSFSYVDLAVDSPMTLGKDSSGYPIYNDKFFRLKVILGYSDNTDIIDKLNIDNPENAELIKKALKSAKIILYLNPYSHDIQFEENGSVTLKIQFIAAMSSIMNSLNALELNDTYNKVADSEEKFNANAFTQKRDIEEIKKDCTKSEEQKQKIIDDKQKQIDTALSDQKTSLETEKNILYSQIYSILLGLSNNSSVSARPKIYSALFDKYAVGASPSIGDDEVLNDPVQLRIKNLNLVRNENVAKSYKIDSISESDREQYKIIDTNLEKKELVLTDNGSYQIVTSTINDEIIKTGEKFAEELLKTQKTKFTDTDGKYLVKFVFLGDLIDVFASSANKLSNSDRPRIILNNFRLEIPTEPIGELADRKLSDPNLSPYNTDARYNIIDLNIADIPISLNMLNTFIIERMIKPRRITYPLSTLITDIITDVVSPAVSPSVFGRKTVLNKSIRLSSLPITIPFKKQGLIDAVTGKSSNQFNGILTEDALEVLKTHDSTIQNINEDIANYYILYCSNELPIKFYNNNGNYDEDAKIGVYHFFVGADRGLIKKVTFSRQDVPFNKEAQFKSSTGDKSLARIREVYDANIMMFGNNIYRPGDFLYIPPLFFTGKAAADLQNKLGLGGYYQVLDVTTTINENIFETALRCAIVGRINEDGKTEQAETGNRSCY